MATETLRPNAAGDVTSICCETPNGEVHWTLVDEETPDDGTTVVRNYSETGTLDSYDLYNLPAHSGSGTINKITVYMRVNNYYGTDYAYTKIKTHSTIYEGDQETIASGTFANFSHQWTTNPYTGEAWTWDEIDALQIGVRLQTTATYHSCRCTQLYVEVDYTSGETPKTSSDAGSGVEGTPLSTAALAGSESGSGVEAFIARLLATAETGYGAEASEIGGGGLLKHLFASELGEGADRLTAKIEIPTKGGGMKLWT